MRLVFPADSDTSVMSTIPESLFLCTTGLKLRVSVTDVLWLIGFSQFRGRVLRVSNVRERSASWGPNPYLSKYLSLWYSYDMDLELSRETSVLCPDFLSSDARNVVSSCSDTRNTDSCHLMWSMNTNESLSREREWEKIRNIFRAISFVQIIIGVAV